MAHRKEALALYHQMLKLESRWPKIPTKFKLKNDTREELGDIYFSRVQANFRENVTSTKDPDTLLRGAKSELEAAERILSNNALGRLRTKRSYNREEDGDANIVVTFVDFLVKRLRGL